MQDRTRQTDADLRAITIVRRLNCAPGTAWAAVTQPERIAAWWGDHVSLEARPDGAFREVWRDDDGREVITAGKIETFDPPRRVSMTWKDMDWPVETEVTFRIDPDGNRAALTLTHAGWDRFPGTDGAALKRAHETGWRRHLDRLATLLNDGSPT